MAERHNGAGSVRPIGSLNRPKKTIILGPSFDPFQHIGSLDRNRSNLWIMWFDPLLMAAAHGAGGSGGGDPAGGTGGGTGGGRDRAGGADGYGDRTGGVGEDCAVGDCGAGYGQEEVEPPRDARSVPTLDVLPLTACLTRHCFSAAADLDAEVIALSPGTLPATNHAALARRRHPAPALLLPR